MSSHRYLRLYRRGVPADIKRLTALAALIALLAWVSGCAPVISEETMTTVNTGIGFSDLKNEPRAYKGERVVLGGAIIKTETQDERTVVEVLQMPLNRRLIPVDPESSKGRFLVEYPEFRDPAVYRKGLLITVVGLVTGMEARPLGEMNYRYPVIRAEEDHLRRPDRGGRTSLGIGLGVIYSN